MSRYPISINRTGIPRCIPSYHRRAISKRNDRRLTRSGIFRLLPAFHRRMMMEGVDRAEKLVQLYFSIVSIYY